MSQPPRVSMFKAISIRKLIFYFILAGSKKGPFYNMCRYCELNRTDAHYQYYLALMTGNFLFMSEKSLPMLNRNFLSGKNEIL